MPQNVQDRLREKLRIVVITDGTLTDEPNTMRRLSDRLERAIDGGATAVMVREKQCATSTLYDFAERLRCKTYDSKAALLINDRIDIALAVGADGVHLGWRSLPPPLVRQLLGPDFLIGFSAHSRNDLEMTAKVDYVTFSPIFPTPSKVGLLEPQGLETLAEMTRDFPTLPMVALGGIDKINAAAVMQAGAAGIAVIRAILASDNAKAAAAALATQVDANR